MSSKETTNNKLYEEKYLSVLNNFPKKFLDHYEAPKIKTISFKTESTSVLGNCSGWKESLVLV